jgi:MFS family permease
MNLLISIPSALLGSVIGSTARGGVAMAQGQLGAKTGVPGEPGEHHRASLADTINISISPAAGLIGGVVGSLLGMRVAFWVGAVLGAAGMDRLDAMLLERIGVDMDALVDRASEVATEAAGKARSGASGEAA